jgi:hypothetical protein
VLKLDFLVFALLGCLYHLGSDMRKLHGADNEERLRAAWDRLDSKVLDYVASVLRSRAYVDHTDEINSIYALVPIIVYCFDKPDGHLSETEIRKIVKWFYYSQIRYRYVSQLPQKLDRDLRILGTSASPFDDLLRVIEEERPLEITAGEFEGRAISHPLYPLMRWYFKSRNAICLTTGLAIRQAMGKRYQLENDHIFPYSRLKEAGYGKDNRVKYALAQEFTNRAILTQVANRMKSDKEADGYLQGVKERFPNALALQSIPDDPELWKIERYEDFLAARRKMLAAELNAFLAGLADTGETTAAVSIEELIAEGESDELEFKSSLRWDYQQQLSNKKLEEVILKAVAAFANSQGGTLLIGVDDAGAVLGLERDYAALGNVDRDRFELHLRNLLNNAFGEAFTATRLKVAFPIIGETEICQIAISSAAKPLILTISDKNGQASQRFFVRNGNSSREMPMNEMHQYVTERFG